MQFPSTSSSKPPLENSEEVSALTRTRQVEAVGSQHTEHSVTQQYLKHQHYYIPLEPRPQPDQERRGPTEDRRKINQRIRKQTILLELRSGRDRRRNHGRSGDIVEHIDIKV